MDRRLLRRGLASAISGILTGSTAEAQQPPMLTSLTAKHHVGEVATVCGHVILYDCHSDSRSMTLTFAPMEAPFPFTVRIVEADRERFGRRLEDQFLGQVVCVQGTIEDMGKKLRVTVPDPTHVAVQKQDEIEPPPRLSTNAHSLCDPGVQWPVPLRKVNPSYTFSAMRDKVHGTVWMRVTVESDGTVGDAQILKPLYPDLDREVESAIRQWRFKPGTYMGNPAPVIVTTEMMFALK